LETPGVEINSLRERRSLYRQQQQGETVPAFHDGETEHECLRGEVEKCCKGFWRRLSAKYVPWARGCVSANAGMNLPPAIGKSILLPTFSAGPECAVQRGERVRSADQSKHPMFPPRSDVRNPNQAARIDFRVCDNLALYFRERRSIFSAERTPERVKKTAANLNATVIIQHDLRDIGKLPAFPAAAR
jgi:hypothetical protein